MTTLDDLTVSVAPQSRAVVRSGATRRLVRAALATPQGAIGATLALVVVLIAAVGPFVEPHSTTGFVSTPFAKPSGVAALGADYLGRDVLSRLLGGGWELLLMGLAATFIGVVLGTIVGVVAAYRGGLVDTVLMRAMDVLLAFPQIVLALLLLSVIGPKVWLIVIAVAVGHIPQIARVMRSAALDVCERDFVQSADLIGLPAWRTMAQEILPNLTSPLMVELGLRMTYSISIIASLSFLGFGVQAPRADWGVMINENRVGLQANWLATGAPVILLAVLTVGLNMFTDAIGRAALGTGWAKARRGVIRHRRAAAEATL
jgi:peptide/nickel transport system permease protein